MARPMRLASIIVSATLLMTACGGGSQSPAGNVLTMIVSFGGEELTNFESVLKPFEDSTGIDVQIESNRDLNAILETRIQGGNPPDVAGMPDPGTMAQFARDGNLIEMPDDVKQTLADDYPETYTDAGTVDGKLVGVFAKVSLKGLIWYNPQQFDSAGYKVPKDWTGVETLADQIANDGTPTWGISLESGAASGWPGTDWIEDFVVRQSGPDVYDQWWQGTLPWTSPEIKQAWEAFGKYATDPKYAAGGPNFEISTAFGNGGDCLFKEPPGCYLVHQASFMSGFFETNFPEVAKAGDTYDYFMMPPIKYNALTASGDVFGMFKDTDGAKKLMAFLISTEAQEAWVKTGGVLSASTKVSADAYPDEATKRAADILSSAEVTRYDASDLMPTAMQAAFWKAILQYVQSPDQLDSILQSLDETRQSAYGS
jgi:alpha-glucoside transport system substrate-binding protein